MTRELAMPFFWRVVLTNGAVFVLGTLVLVLSPATVSARPILSEVAVLAAGLLALVVLNGLLLRTALHPLDRLTRAMAHLDPRQSGQRIDVRGTGPSRPIVESFNAMLERLETERATSTSRALGAQEAERLRIAQELHDEVGQSLTAVLLGLKHAIDRCPPDVAADLELARTATRTSLEEVRRITQRLRPGVLAELGLRGSLSSLASDLTERTGIEVERGFAPGRVELPGETELVLYRVAQEALTNVARHAGATRVWLRLRRRGGTVELVVADDGAGLAPGAAGSGLQGMQERAASVGGELTVRRRDGGGTEVVLAVPAPDAAGEEA